MATTPDLCSLCLPYVLNEVNDIERCRFERHLRTCRSCALERVELLDLLSHVQAVPTSLVPSAGKAELTTDSRADTAKAAKAGRAAKAAQAARAGRAARAAKAAQATRASTVQRQLRSGQVGVAKVTLPTPHIHLSRDGVHRGMGRRQVMGQMRFVAACLMLGLLILSTAPQPMSKTFPPAVRMADQWIHAKSAVAAQQAVSEADAWVDKMTQTPWMSHLMGYVSPADRYRV